MDAWGPSTYYLRADEAGIVDVQIVAYDDGHVLRYDVTHIEDAYGGLAEAALELREFAAYEVRETAIQHTLRLASRNR